MAYLKLLQEQRKRLMNEAQFLEKLHLVVIRIVEQQVNATLVEFESLPARHKAVEDLDEVRESGAVVMTVCHGHLQVRKNMGCGLFRAF